MRWFYGTTAMLLSLVVGPLADMAQAQPTPTAAICPVETASASTISCLQAAYADLDQQGNTAY